MSNKRSIISDEEDLILDEDITMNIPMSSYPNLIVIEVIASGKVFSTKPGIS